MTNMDNNHRNIVTAILILAWVSMGLYMEIGGPTMLDLRIRFDSNPEEVARSVSAQGVGIFLGAVIGGCFVDMLGTWKLILVTCAQLLSAASILSMPFIGSISVMWLMFFGLGTATGIVNVSGQRILLEMWQEKAPSPMHAMHMGFGIGAVAAPLIVNPFLAVLDFTTTNTSTNSSSDIHSAYVIVEESRVHLAYVTIGLISAMLSLPLFIYLFITCCTRKNMDEYVSFGGENKSSDLGKRRGLIQTINPATYAGGSLTFGLFVFIIISLYFLNLVGGEQLFGNFIRTYSVDELHFPRNEASYLDTTYWGFFTIGRFLGAVFAHFIHIRTLLLVDVVLNLLAITFLNIFTDKNKTMFWVFVAVIGCLIAPLFPAGISYANTQIEVGGLVLTLLVISTGIGDLLYIWIEGVLYHNYGPGTILYAMQVSATLVILITTVFVVFTYNREDRFSNTGRRANKEGPDEDVIGEEMRYTQLDRNSV